MKDEKAMKRLKSVILLALVVVLLGIQPAMAVAIGAQEGVLVATEGGDKATETPVEVDVNVTEAPAGNQLFGFDRTLVIVVGVLVVVLLIGLVARGGRGD